jgi:phospholipid transport system transporter-binding protein
MITSGDGHMQVAGPMVMATATEVKADGEAALAAGAHTVDLSAVTDVDSSAVAVLLAWTRLARQRGQDFTITQVPAAIHSLAVLYGVAEMLPLA